MLKKINLLTLLIGCACMATSVSADEQHPWAGIANASAFAQRLLEYRDKHGWSELRSSLFKDAKYAYEKRILVAEKLLYTFLWIDLMREDEGKYITNWVDKVKEANWIHPNMPDQINYDEHVLGERLSDDFLKFFFANGDLMRSTYNQWNPTDLLTEVFEVLNYLYNNHQYQFKRHTSLAFAIAFVHDVPPPSGWPHAQVGQDVLPRHLRSPEDVFIYFTNPRNAQMFHHSIRRLSLSDAIYLVDLIASPQEIHWVHNTINYKPDSYDNVYSMVQYDFRRAQTEKYHWLYDDYSLPVIYEAGGICVDQAYFASQAGKIQGLPTIEFLGSGLDGRHAWFGYLPPNGGWNMEAGRYADQKYVTGYGFNPQTWSFTSDHDITFLREGYQNSRGYFSSQLHYFWARMYSSLEDLEKAEKAAENAIALERRNTPAWSLLIDLRKRLNLSRTRIDATYRSVLSAVRSFSDLEAKFITDFALFLESTGRANMAKKERSRITWKNKDSRSDLAVSSAAAILKESMRSDSRAAQMHVYRRQLYQLGGQGGIQVLDDFVFPFVDHLYRKRRTTDAKTAILEAEKVLRSTPGSQMARDIERVKNQLRL